MMLVALVLAWVVAFLPRLPAHRGTRATRRPVDVLLVARLLALAVASGRPLGRALDDVRTRLPRPDRIEIDAIIGRAARTGLTRALVDTTGPLSELTERLAKAQVTGAPLGQAIDAFITTVHDARRFRAVEEARTVGVKLIVPLTLLLLPGFLALVVAPYVIEQIDALVGSAIP